MVSTESVPCSDELYITGGTGGRRSDGARRPFLVVTYEDEREPAENIFFVLGADATLRMKRVAAPLIPFVERGFGACRVGDERAKVACDGFEV